MCNEDEDTDGDEWNDLDDNCPGVANPEQVDDDGDGDGNACDSDEAGDNNASFK